MLAGLAAMHNLETTPPGLRLIAKWHMVMPLATMVFGYFPAKKLGWMEDTPEGVAREWAGSRARFQHSWRAADGKRYSDKQGLVQQFSSVKAPILAVGVTDDEYGTVPAVERLLAYFDQSPRIHLRIAPESIQEPAIGHFGFFNSRFEHKLWPLPLRWLHSGRISEGVPGVQTHFPPKPGLIVS
jgi:predicted alpha/beta hydrolase